MVIMCSKADDVSVCMVVDRNNSYWPIGSYEMPSVPLTWLFREPKPLAPSSGAGLDSAEVGVHTQEAWCTALAHPNTAMYL